MQQWNFVSYRIFHIIVSNEGSLFTGNPLAILALFTCLDDVLFV